MVILCYHCPVLTIQREFVKLFPPGHLIRKKDSASLTDPCRRIWPTSRTGYVWQGNLYYDIDRVFRLSAFFLSKIERYTTDAIQFAYRRVIDSPLILPLSPKSKHYLLEYHTLRDGQFWQKPWASPIIVHQPHIHVNDLTNAYLNSLQKRINALDLPDKLNYKPLYYNHFASF